MCMKKLWSASLLVLVFSGCLKDSVVRKFTYYKPVYKTTAEARADIKSTDPTDIQLPGKLFYKDGYVFLNEMYKGVHIIDIRNTSKPRAVAFVKIPGSVDIAVRGNILYADMYTDLVAVDISNPLSVKLTSTVENVFPDNLYRSYQDSGMVIADWIRVDTTVREEDFGGWMKGMEDSNPIALQNFNSRGASANGTGGSMARFGLSRDRLYTVSYSDLKVFNTSVAEKPVYVKSFSFGQGTIETVFPFGNYLFIGSMAGMYIFDASDKDNPVQVSKFEHARVCDPVVTDGENAYVTLRNGSTCGGFINQLDVLSVRDITNPVLLKSYPMTNPHGLAKDGTTLLICEGADGLRVLNAADPNNVKTVGHLKGFITYDVIALNGTALVSASDGLYLVNYSQPADPMILASLKINNK